MNVYSGIRTFLKSPIFDKTNEDRKFHVYGLPFDDMVTYRSGTRMGPSQLREASLMLTDGDHYHYRTNPQEQTVDFGDIDKKDEIVRRLTPSFKKGTIPIILGGDHYNTLYSMRAASIGHRSEIDVIHFDAHCDTWDGESNHGTFLREAIEEGIIGSVVQYGIRSPMPSSLHDYRRDVIETFGSEFFDDINLENTIASVIDSFRNPIYVTFDIDFYDSSIAPGTGTPEPDGLYFKNAKKIFNALRQVKDKVIGFDLMEVSPPYDSSDMTSILGANTIYDFMAAMMLC